MIKRNPLRWMQFDPEIVGLEVDGLKLEELGAYFKLIRHLWPKGPMPLADIRKVARKQTDALLPLLIEVDGGYSMAWLEEARGLAEKSSEHQRARAERGWEKRRADTMPRQAPASPGNAEGEEKKKEKEEADTPFKSEGFLSAWATWEASRREARKPITPTARRLQLKKCAQIGEARAIAMLLHSAEGGYQGLFEPRVNGQPTPPPAPTTTAKAKGWLTPTGT